MRVLLAGTLGGQGGIQSHLRWLAKALGEEGIETLVLSLGSDQSPPVDEHLFKKLWNQNVQLQCCVSYKNNRSHKRLGGLFRLKEIVNFIDEFSPDIYLAVGTGWNLFIPVLMSGSKATRIFHEVMSGVPNGWHDSRWCVKFFFDEVIGQSASVSQNFCREFRWQKEIHTLPAFPEPLEITATLPKVTQKIIPQGTAKGALFSRLVPHKQAFWLVQQWQYLKKYLSELHIHGSGEEEELIQNYVNEQDIGTQVKCFGSYPDGQDYVNLLSSYDITLLPTIGEEGAPLVLLESMACGVPFLSYRVGGIADYGTNNPDVFIVNPCPKEFCRGLNQFTYSLANNRIDQKRLQQFYLKRYSYSSLKHQWIIFLENLVA
ncbi:glycosyltransferase [Synechococcales cyanobacterium C]|uniref:Glycosyltransferase n=1 Tax=Petrachloros mirabilis ULC683 TaxID=2781853 RepID=A0A8K2A856_9CYAN|nr:glycosyltransferase [Petrachloros mirabilis]NCJ07654.1 glycosyltransferase [Petrachloros mirabilis ULC683]